jgi:hypothetical protein
MGRPLFEHFVSGQSFKQWYWLKEELVDICKRLDISYSGSKQDLTDRIAAAIDYGTNHRAVKPKRPEKKNSLFDWANAALSPKTVITDSYTNGPNTRKFFKLHCGPKFSFTIPFMDWMKKNAGKTLAAAVEEWKRQDSERRKPGFKTVIPASNQYNKYLRDFFNDNPGSSIETARHFWSLKRSLPAKQGKHIYERSDLKLK